MVSEAPKKKTKRDIPKTSINWQPCTDYVPQKHTFNTDNSGCKIQDDEVSILSCFEQFISDDIMTKIAKQTNLYHSQSQTSRAASHDRKWRDVTKNELYNFIGVSLLMAQVKKLKLKDYWSKDALLSTPIFGQIFSRDRYFAILHNLHFVDNNSDDNVKEDKLWKIRMILTHIQKTYQDTLYPFENLCIDESLMLFKGRLSFKQYIPSKRHRFGVKFYVLCDCETGYILNFIIYCGAGSDISEVADDVGISGNIVLTLMRKYLDVGHTLYTDNWYTSPNLYNLLFSRKTNACGTVKQNRKNMPVLKNKLKSGEIEAYNSKNLLSLKWQDKREVTLLSTFHTSEIVTTDKKDPKTKEYRRKPKCVIDYNGNMGAVDRTDMLQSSIESVRKSVKWYKKVFLHIIDMTLLNAHAVYKMKTGSNIPIANFQLSLVKEIFEKYHVEKPRHTTRKTNDEDSPLRLTGRHFISHLEKNERSQQTRKRCVVCSKKKIRKETTYGCQPCDVPLCQISCFENYHTKKVYWA